MSRKKNKRSSKKRDFFAIPRVLTPLFFIAFLVASVAWIQPHSETNWLTYMFTEQGILPVALFCALMTVLSIRRWRFVLLWLALSGVALLVFGHPCFGSPSGSVPAKTMTVMTYNIDHFDIDKSGVIAALRESNADLIFLQEACALDKQKEVGEELCHELKGYRYVVASSNMILSKHPIKLEKSINVPTKWPVKQFPVALVESPVGKVRVMCVHMEPSWISFPPNMATYPSVVDKVVKDRVAQTDLIRAALMPSKEPVILAGDFNCPPQSESVNRIQETFTDCFAKTARGFGWTIGSKMPYRRIDYVWVRGLSPMSSEVGTSMASDHLPLTAIVGK